MGADHAQLHRRDRAALEADTKPRKGIGSAAASDPKLMISPIPALFTSTSIRPA